MVSFSPKGAILFPSKFVHLYFTENIKEAIFLFLQFADVFRKMEKWSDWKIIDRWRYLPALTVLFLLLIAFLFIDFDKNKRNKTREMQNKKAKMRKRDKQVQRQESPLQGIDDRQGKMVRFLREKRTKIETRLSAGRRGKIVAEQCSKGAQRISTASRSQRTL